MKRSMTPRLAARALAGIGVAAALTSAACGQTYEPHFPVPAAMQTLRQHMFDAEVNALTFQSMETIMDTRRVANAGPVWALPRNEQSPDFTYAFEGKTHTALEGFDRTFTNALLIIKDGKIVYETYRNHSGETSRFMSWSMSKSITSLLVGIAIDEGKIGSVDDPITKYVPELKGAGYDGVSLRQALEMRSGVDFEERYDFQNPSPAQHAFQTALVENSARYADPARTVKRAIPPGQKFEYRTLDTAVMGWVLERAVGTTISDYTAKKLWGPLGAESYGSWIMDGPPNGDGREFNGAGYVARLRDYGRLGLMMLNRGKANGRQVVSARWVAESTAPTKGEANSPGAPMGYGYYWWTIVGTHAYTALGLQGQHIYVDPDTRTVVVKLSYFPPGNSKVADESIALLRAASLWRPQR